MPSLSLCALALLPALSGAQSGKPSSNWSRTDLSPLTLAERSEAVLHRATNVAFKYEYLFHIRSGKGNFPGLVFIKDRKTFRIEEPVVSNVERIGMTPTTYVGNGKQFSKIVFPPGLNHAVIKKSNRPFPREVAPNILESWPRDCIQDLFSALNGNGAPLTSLVRAAQRDSSFSVETDVRTIMIPDKKGKPVPIKQYRIFAKRKGQGTFYYEVVINATNYLPTTMSTADEEFGVLYATAMHATAWYLKHVPFTSDMFKLDVLKYRAQ